MINRRSIPVLLLGCLSGSTLFAQVDSVRAAGYFHQAEQICERDAGRLWGVSLCGPIVIADPLTRTIATSVAPPDAPRPPALGFANAAMRWGDIRWTTLVWQLIPRIRAPGPES